MLGNGLFTQGVKISTVKAVMMRAHQGRKKISKHEYPAIPEDADDNTSEKTNLKLLHDEWSKSKGPDPQRLKVLLTRTHRSRRTEILELREFDGFSHTSKIPYA